jgi:hypothetical protein
VARDRGEDLERVVQYQLVRGCYSSISRSIVSVNIKPYSDALLAISM